jgi:hypothetical protein
MNAYDESVIAELRAWQKKMLKRPFPFKWSFKKNSNKDQ